MKKHYNILVLGISHKTAPIQIREKLAFSPEKIPGALMSLREVLLVEEAVLLSTCNRTEIYCRFAFLEAEHIKKLLWWWQNSLRVSDDMASYVYVHQGEQAVRHLLRVASGLDSMILGEPQVLGQLKSAYQVANEENAIRRDFSRLFQLSFSTAKKIRTATHIATYPVSVAFAAVSLAKKIFSHLYIATVVLIGAGENTELILQHLVTKKIKRIVILNRTLEKAKLLANRYGVEYDALDKLLVHLAQADIVVSSVANQHPILCQQHIEKAFLGAKRRPMLMIDLGVPRNISPALGEHDDIYLYSVDDLQGIIQQNKKHREKAAIEAEAIVSRSVDYYMNWIKSADQIKAISLLRQEADKIKQEAILKAHKRLDKGDDPKLVVEAMLHQLTQKLMHLPTISLRKNLPFKNVVEEVE